MKHDLCSLRASFDLLLQNELGRGKRGNIGFNCIKWDAEVSQIIQSKMRVGAMLVNQPSVSDVSPSY